MKGIKITRIIVWCLILVFYITAVCGFLMAGETWYDACYHAIQLFVLSYSAPENANILLYISRMVCPLLTATGILSAMGNLLAQMRDRIVSRMSGATALYYDNEEMTAYAGVFTHPVLMGDKINHAAKSHVLLFENDVDSLAFYEKMEGQIPEDSKVYIKLTEIDSKLLKDSRVYHFNIHEIVARTYWQERHLQKYLVDGVMKAKIAIIGFGEMGENLLSYGLMNNIYALNQEIEYHIWGETTGYKNALGTFNMMNKDSITYHQRTWEEDLELIKSCQRVIVAKENDIDLVQALLYMNSDAEIDVYNPDGADLCALYASDKIRTFGEQEQVITEENIKSDVLYRDAKKINYNYLVTTDSTGEYTWSRSDVENVMEEKWNELNGFLKGSNVASTDYHKIRRLVMEAGNTSEDTLAEMEHIRWSRYHFVNHWSYAPVRDNKKRKHHLLVPYSELSQAEKQKDIEAVRIMMK